VKDVKRDKETNIIHIKKKTVINILLMTETANCKLILLTNGDLLTSGVE